MKKIMILVGAVMVATGCASLDKTLTGGQSAMPDAEQRKVLVKSFPDLTDSQKQQFVGGKPWIGMSQNHLEALWGGEPTKKQNKLTAAGNQEIQLYAVRVGNWKTGIVTKYYRATMTDGKLTEFQELDGDVGSFDKL